MFTLFNWHEILEKCTSIFETYQCQGTSLGLEIVPNLIYRAVCDNWFPFVVGIARCSVLVDWELSPFKIPTGFQELI